MPRGDGTGPEGLGPMTGREAGYCAGYDRPGFANDVCRRGFGRGQGKGRGNRRGFSRRSGNAPVNYSNANGTSDSNINTTEDEKINYLKKEEKILKAELENIQKRIDKLEKDEK